jgi:hypothetical protein
MKYVKIIKHIVEFVIDKNGGAPIEEKLNKDWRNEISQGKITMKGFSAPHEGVNKGKVVFYVETTDPEFIDKYLQENMEELLTYESDLSKNLKKLQNEATS